jgi:putative copper resistance protein D
MLTRRPVVAVRGLAVLGAVAVVAVLVAISFSGAAAATALADPGAAVRWGLPVVDVLTDLALAVTLGALALVIGIVPRRAAVEAHPDRRSTAPGGTSAVGAAWPAGTTVTAVAAGVWTVLAVVRVVLTYAQVSGSPVDLGSSGAQLWLFVTQVDVGRAYAGIVLVAAAVTALALAVGTPTGAGWTGALALVALWMQSGTRHASGAAHHEVATEAVLLHLLGAAVWIGALAALALLARRLGTDLPVAVRRYSVVAGWCLAAVGVSGLVNGFIRVGGWSDLGTRYGLLLITKAVLLAALGALGLAHRRMVIPQLSTGAGGAFARLVLVELAVMVAVALSSSAPPVPNAPVSDTSPAFRVIGHSLPPELTGARWFTVWNWDVVTAAAAAAGLVVYLRWVWRLHRRGDRWPVGRTAAWVTAMVVFVWTTSGGPNAYGHVLFSAHMVQHMVLATLVPVFLALSAPVSLALRALPARSTRLAGDTSRGPREWILVLVHSRVGRFLANPVVAAANFVASMIVFYYSGVFEWSLRTTEGHLFMVVHFSLVGYLFANALIGVDPGPQRPGYPQRLLLLFATMGFHAFFGISLMSGDGLLVADWFGLLGRPWGPSAIADQQAGGGIAWGIGELPTLALAVAVAVAWARDDERLARRRDRQVDRAGDIEMDEYNAMLARLAGRDAGQRSDGRRDEPHDARQHDASQHDASQGETDR